MLLQETAVVESVAREKHTDTHTHTHTHTPKKFRFPIKLRILVSQREQHTLLEHHNMFNTFTDSQTFFWGEKF